MSSITYKQLEELGLVEIEVVEDIHWSPEQMAGDTYKDNPQREHEYINSLRENGVWSVMLLFRLRSDMPWVTVDGIHGIADYNYANEWVREEMQAKAVRLVNDLVSQLTR